MKDGKTEYLQMIQEPICRMSTISAIFKGFAATIVAGIATLTYTDVNTLVLFFIDRLSIQVQHSYEKNFLSTSKGVRKFKRFLGRLFISSTMFCKSSSEMSAKEVPFGKNCRSRPLVFSFVPRCHGE